MEEKVGQAWYQAEIIWIKTGTRRKWRESGLVEGKTAMT